MEINPSSTRPTTQVPAPPRFTSSLIGKVLILGAIAIGLLIPLLMISGLVEERRERASEATTEVSAKWGGAQTIISPMLAVPYTLATVEGKDTTYTTEHVYLLPEQLKANATSKVEERKRGIYSIPVYTADITLEGRWNMGDLAGFKHLSALRFAEAEVVMGISDLKGIKDYITVRAESKDLRLEPRHGKALEYYDEESYSYTQSRASLLSAPMPLEYDSTQTLTFATTISVDGSQRLGIAPTGSSTRIEMQSSWADPSFGGQFLPDSSEISRDGFKAVWQMVDYNRGYSSTLEDSTLGTILSEVPEVSFFQAVNQYTQTERSVKYGILIILLTFVSIFFIEMSMRVQNVNINLFHYLLVGLALALFYTLLLSISEFLGFGWAYLIASVMTIGLIGLYFRSLLPPGRHGLILVGILGFLYLLVYMLIQLDSYALLTGSIGLFIILAIVMYVASKLFK